MSNYHFHYIKNHFKDVHPGHPNCETGLNFDHLAMFGAFDPENTNSDNNPAELKKSFWENINRLCTWDDNKDEAEADCVDTANDKSILKIRNDSGTWDPCDSALTYSSLNADFGDDSICFHSMNISEHEYKKWAEIDFIVIKKGKKSAAGHFGKAVKGQLIKYIVMNQITSTDQFDKFNFDGFQWDGEVFIKEHSS